MNSRILAPTFVPTPPTDDPPPIPRLKWVSIAEAAAVAVAERAAAAMLATNTVKDEDRDGGGVVAGGCEDRDEQDEDRDVGRVV